MPSPFILTKLALPILQAALQADIKQLNRLSSEHSGSAAALSPLTDLINRQNNSIGHVAAAGVDSLAATYEIINKNLQLQREAATISDAINSVATATEEMAASASEISQSANATAERANEAMLKPNPVTRPLPQ